MYNACTIMYIHIRSQASDWKKRKRERERKKERKREKEREKEREE